MKNKHVDLTRKRLLIRMIGICFFGTLFMVSMHHFIDEGIATYIPTTVKFENFNVTLGIIIFDAFLLLMWLPFCVDGGYIKGFDDGFQYLPTYRFRKKLTIVAYVLINNSLQPFLRIVNLNDVKEVKFTFSRHWGVYGYSRYSIMFILTLVNDEKITLNINPMDNGAFLPSGKGAIPVFHCTTHYDMLNMASFLTSQGAKLDDPYQLCEALKDESLILYDYLETMNKKILF